MTLRPVFVDAVLIACAFSAQAFAQQVNSSEEANDEIPEVIVSAQRRSERLQDVPVTVQAVSATQLATAGVTNIRDLGELVPSLNVNVATSNTITYLRGVGNSSWFPGLETPVAIYVDGVYMASALTTLFDFANVDRLEVLKVHIPVDGERGFHRIVNADSRRT
jgi:iron complex outermembrane receptor protein